MDLRKAFDTIDHNMILSKLAYYDVRGPAFGWVRGYLNLEPLMEFHIFICYNKHLVFSKIISLHCSLTF